MTDTANSPTAPRDPLLLAARLFLWFLIGTLSLACVFVTLGLPVVAVMQSQIMAELTSEGMASGKEVIGAMLALLASAAVFLGLAVYFLVLLLRIVNSVKQGDPFIADNAQRLARMGWVAVAAQVAIIPLAAMALWLDEAIGDQPGTTFETDVSINPPGILLVLILFILARVFRKGAAMRDELEGTV